MINKDPLVLYNTRQNMYRCVVVKWQHGIPINMNIKQDSIGLNFTLSSNHDANIIFYKL